MPEKSLPFFRQNKPSQEQNPQSQLNNAFGFLGKLLSKGTRDETRATPNVYGAGANLVYQEEKPQVVQFYADRLTSVFRKLSFITILVFLALLAVNKYLDLKLAGQRVMVNSIANEAARYSLVRRQALEIDKKSKFYHQTMAARSVLGDKVSDTFNKIMPDIKLLDMEIDRDGFNMIIEVGSPLEFAKLIASYMESSHIASISLKSASLMSSRDVFRVQLEGKYK